MPITTATTIRPDPKELARQYAPTPREAERVVVAAVKRTRGPLYGRSSQLLARAWPDWDYRVTPGRLRVARRVFTRVEGADLVVWLGTDAFRRRRGEKARPALTAADQSRVAAAINEAGEGIISDHIRRGIDRLYSRL